MPHAGRSDSPPAVSAAERGDGDGGGDDADSEAGGLLLPTRRAVEGFEHRILAFLGFKQCDGSAEGLMPGALELSQAAWPLSFRACLSDSQPYPQCPK